MTAKYERFLRVVTGTLGFAYLTSIAFIARELFFSFAVWKLLLCILGLPGAAVFLFYAFHREYQGDGAGLGGTGGPASAGVTWPPPSRPPALSAGAAAAMPTDFAILECRGIVLPNKCAAPNGGPPPNPAIGETLGIYRDYPCSKGCT